MDIGDIDKIKLPDKLLEGIFEKQSEVEKEFGIIEGFPERLLFGKLENLHLPEVCKHVQQNILWRMTEEIHELSVALRNGKNWRKAKYFTDLNEALDEVADVMIYFVNLCLAMGITPEKLTEIVLKKIRVNYDRIKSKY